MMIKHDVSLKDYSYMKIGGTAKNFLEFRSIAELEEGMKEWREICDDDEHFRDITIIGSASNILFEKDQYDGLFLHNCMITIKKFEQDDIEVGAGATIDEINNFCIENSLRGLEWSGGLPGTLGGAIFGNAGAFGKETKDNVESVKSYDFFAQKIIERENSDCLFDYRNSIFKSHKLSEIIVSAVLSLKIGQSDIISKETQEKIEYRISRQPLDYPTLGSTFKNVDVKLASPELLEQVKAEIKTDPFPVIPIAYLIHLAGLSGTKIGGIEISTKHPNFLINHGDATADDVKKTIDLIQKTIREKFGVTPEPEIREL